MARAAAPHSTASIWSTVGVRARRLRGGACGGSPMTGPHERAEDREDEGDRPLPLDHEVCLARRAAEDLLAVAYFNDHLQAGPAARDLVGPALAAQDAHQGGAVGGDAGGALDPPAQGRAGVGAAGGEPGLHPRPGAVALGGGDEQDGLQRRAERLEGGEGGALLDAVAPPDG